jgi:membrane peptidoglycan carboxypeptidase
MTGNGRNGYPRNGHGNGRNGKNGRNGNGYRNGHLPAANNRNRRRRREQRRQARARSRRFVLLSILVAVLVAAAVAVGAAFTGVEAFRESCSLTSLRPVALGQNSFVYAADGSILGSIPAEKNRQPVPLARMSPRIAEATVAVEDRRFYEHSGLDYEGILRAALRAARRSPSSSSATSTSRWGTRSPGSGRPRRPASR